MSLLTLSNIKIRFAENVLVWGSYTTAEALAITKMAELIGKWKFTVAVLNENTKIFVIHIVILETMSIHLTQEAQIALLLVELKEYIVFYI